MITMLDCIKKGVPVGHTVLDKAKENTAPIKTLIPDLNEIEEIFMIASGSSFNAANCASPFMEKVTKSQVFALLPNTFLKKTVCNSKALYLFISQTGTSSLVKEQVIRVKEMGCKTISLRNP